MALISDQQTAVDRVGETWFAENVQPLWEKHLLPLGPFSQYLEIGVFSGRSLLWAATNLLGDGGAAEGVDRWLPYRRGAEAEAVVAQAKTNAFERMRVFNALEDGEREIRLNEISSLDFLANLIGKYRQKFDLIYVDGAHDAPTALTDICLCWEMLSVGGGLIVDDVDLRAGRRLRQGPLSGEATDAFLICFAGRYRVLYKTAKQLAVVKEN